MRHASISPLALVFLLAISGAGMASEPISSDKPPTTSLADGRTGIIAFEALTPDNSHAFVSRQVTRKSTIAGKLQLPAGAKGLVPAMVIVHASGGVLPNEFEWADRLNGWGIASFVIDNFTGRGVAGVEYDQALLSRAADDAGALAALRLLATHPLIDPKRIGVMGFSRGGGVSLDTALEPVRRAVIDGDLSFRVHVPLYPGCGIPWIATQTDHSPILMLLGGKDDTTPAAPCSAYADALRQRGSAVTVIIYPDAHHAFDYGYPATRYPLKISSLNCNGIVDLDTGTFNMRENDQLVTGAAAETARKSSYVRGATEGGDPEAREKAPKDLAVFLKANSMMP